MQVLLRVLCFASLLLPSPSCLLERPKYCIKNFLKSLVFVIDIDPVGTAFQVSVLPVFFYNPHHIASV